MVLNVDTENLKKNGELLIELSNDFDNLQKEFFLKIQELHKRGIWIGTEGAQNTSAVRFIKASQEEQPDYERFAKSMKELGELMIDCSNRVDKFQKESRIK